MMVRSGFHSLVAGMLILGLQNKLAADVTQIIDGPEKPWTYEFVVDEARQTQPALKYRLLPNRLSREPGNAAPSYYRALHQLNHHAEDDLKESNECSRFELMLRPHASKQERAEAVGVDRVRTSVAKFADVFSLLQTAVTREHCDWEIDFRGMDGIETTRIPLQDFYEFRKLARLIQQKARVAIVDKDYAEAFRMIQMGFQLGRDVAKCPLIVSGLIGIAISIEMQVLVMEVIAQPDSPNLYWALATIPRPLIDLSPSLEEELNLALKFPILRDAEHSHMADEWKQMLNQSLQYLHEIQGKSAAIEPSSGTNESKPAAAESVETFVSREVGRARNELRMLGYVPEQIAAMSDIQAIAVHDAALVRHKRDNALKIMYVPYPQVAGLLNWANDRNQIAANGQDLSQLKESIKLFETLHPSVRQALVASIRLDRLLVRSQVVEAIRMHAAATDGTFPTSLSEVKIVPIPIDPITGKEIPYHLEDETAFFEFPTPVERIPSLAEITKVTLRKSKR